MFEKQSKNAPNRRGGRREGAGRKAGGKNRRTLRNETVDSGRRMPLEHMLAVMDDPKASQDRRDRMAIAAAPYLHPRLSSIDSTVKLAAEVTVTLSEDERRERARRMIAEAFAERVPLTVEGEYKVIAGKDNRDAVTVSGVQANGEASDERKG
jgi:hypothetical protein